ncbi:uncharacterized protein LOC121757426 [Salvia splendens]|uniref:uncharacterized protein LOC121757426 n=1 Tax=Salvia splendens TaxID=180675 RepID=UPI001C26406D|nr:uncharacterized protein LOC121757426 [Salvia splendens]
MPSPQTLTFPPRIKELPYPVAIGTRGTAGSLIMREIEYFSRLQLGHNKPLHQLGNQLTGSKRESAITSVPEKKKKRASNKLIPSMCSMVEVAESKQAKTASSGFAYRSLKADVKRS